MVVWQRQFSAFLKDLTDLVFISSVLELSAANQTHSSSVDILCLHLMRSRFTEMLIMQKGTSKDNRKYIFIRKK